MKSNFLFPFLYNLLFISVVISCKNQNNKPVVSAELDSTGLESGSRILDNIVAYGETDDPKSLRYLNFVEYSGFVGRSLKNLKQEFSKDSFEIKLVFNHTPQLIDIVSFGDSSVYSAKIFLSPGDTLNFKIENKNISFSGSNRAEYQFYQDLNSQDFQWPIYENDLMTYKRQLDSTHHLEIKFFEKFLLRNEVSEKFVDQVKGDLKFSYYNRLLEPIISTQDSISGQIEQFNKFDGYFDQMSLEDFQREDLIKNPNFRKALVLYLRHFFLTDYPDYSIQEFLNEKEFVTDNLKNKVKEYAMARTINDYFSEDLGNDLNSREELLIAISEYKKLFPQSPYMEPIVDIEQTLEMYNFQIPESILEENVLNPQGDTIQLKNAFRDTQTNIKALDFWATWCAPCIKEIKLAREFRKDLSQEHNVAWLYFSIDHQHEDWVKGLNILEEYFDSKYQYQIIDPKNSKFLEFLKIQKKGRIEIPKYAIIDSELKIISNNAPKPSQSIRFMNLIQKVKDLQLDEIQ